MSAGRSITEPQQYFPPFPSRAQIKLGTVCICSRQAGKPADHEPCPSLGAPSFGPVTGTRQAWEGPRGTRQCPPPVVASLSFLRRILYSSAWHDWQLTNFDGGKKFLVSGPTRCYPCTSVCTHTHADACHTRAHTHTTHAHMSTHTLSHARFFSPPSHAASLTRTGFLFCSFPTLIFLDFTLLFSF